MVEDEFDDLRLDVIRVSGGELAENGWDPELDTALDAIQQGHQAPPRRNNKMSGETPDTTRKTPAEHILQFFSFEHLPEHLRAGSEPFHRLAHELVLNTPAGPEQTVALRKLLEAKDAAVRALIPL